ncbi:Thylakoid lumenal protein like [Actinidia chinensis var. chinensis]|uniref:Thylakoid lumenal protein like n=1 Tax=Actinidia chinensis var. chinensis TaxID=1590841 RepID=A0A2R6QNL6_ACTCC|nr:Thylakoid lumenal protein like [Actinidia chinensis var. chinensis]
MALTSISLLPMKSQFSSSFSHRPLKSPSKPLLVVCQAQPQNQNHIHKSGNWKTLVSTALAAAVVTVGADMSALADLNKFEAEQRGEFGIGSAAQFGSADLRKAVHVNENFRLVSSSVDVNNAFQWVLLSNLSCLAAKELGYVWGFIR